VRGPLLFVAATLITMTIIACSSTPPEAPGQLESPARNRSGTRDDSDDPPKASNLASAEAGTGTGGDASAQCVTAPPNNKCGLAPQCGCAANETCEVTNESTGATSCVTGGSATLGRPCNAAGDCVAGLTCAWGACRPYCNGALTPCTDPGTGLCITVDDEAGKPLPNLTVCTVACDPFDPKGVCGTNSCHWFESQYKPHKVSDCNYPGTGQLKATCEGDSDCAAGLLCLGSKCEKWCRIGQAGDCPSNTKCTDYFGVDAPVIGGVTRGVCLAN
jgi:hypothetical protein